MSIFSDFDFKYVAVSLYRQQKVSLAKAASMAGVALARMKEILMENGIRLRLGAEGRRELEEDYKTLKDSRKKQI